jgi:hypothetical protein
MRKKYDHDVLLRWRTQLTDFERDTLLPQLIGRLKTLQNMFSEMLTLMASAEKDPAFIQALQKVINPTSIPMKDGLVLPHVMYCTQFKSQVERDFLSPISTLLDFGKQVSDFRTFAKFMNELAIVASSVTQNESQLFWLSLKPFAHVLNSTTKELVATTEPVEYSIILRPFDIWIKNLNQVASGTIGTIDSWAKEQSNWKTQYLAFRSNESNSRNNLIVLCVNIATVFVAVSVSMSFLFLPDVWTSKKENDQLMIEKQLVEKSLNESKAKIDSLESQLKQGEKK